MIPLHKDVSDMAVKMKHLGERMEATGRRHNHQKLIDHGAEVQNAAHQAHLWSLEIEKENLQ